MLSNEVFGRCLSCLVALITLLLLSQNGSAFPSLDVQGCGEVAQHISQAVKNNKTMVVECEKLKGTNIELKAAIHPPRKLSGSGICFGRIEKRIYNPANGEYYLEILEAEGYAFESRDCSRFSSTSNLVYMESLLEDGVAVVLFGSQEEIKDNVVNAGNLCKDKDKLVLTKIGIGALSDKDRLMYLMYFSAVGNRKANYQCVIEVKISEVAGLSFAESATLMD